MIYTSTPRNDGFGAQFQNIIWDILYVKEFLRGDYVLTIPTLMEHNYNSNPNFIKELFEFMNLRKLFKLNSEMEEPIQYLTPGQSYSIIEANIRNFLDSYTMNEVRKVFFEDKKSPFEKEHFNIAIHIRRMNQNDSRDIYITENQYIQLFNKLKILYPENNVRFHIYSQGSLSEFTNYESDRTVFHLNETIQETFLGFVYSDILVCTSSSFSYLGAHYNTNKVFAFRFWHALSNLWEVIG